MTVIDDDKDDEYRRTKPFKEEISLTEGCQKLFMMMSCIWTNVFNLDSFDNFDIEDTAHSQPCAYNFIPLEMYVNTSYLYKYIFNSILSSLYY